jgi:hypothetical protein
MARAFHTDDRTYSNFQPAELTKLCGVPQGRWPVYVIKELLDNAVAALEEHCNGTGMIKVTVSREGMYIEDSGPGIPDGALDRILDFTQFGGSNRHHKLPTRGAQGNAVMTVFGISSAWDSEIHVRRRSGPELGFRVMVNPVKQEVQVVRTEIGDTGSSRVYVEWPSSGLPWKRGGAVEEDVLNIAKSFALFNPHITFMIRDCMNGLKVHSVPSIVDSKPCLSPLPLAGAAQWFTIDEFADRLAADVRARPDMTMYAWESEFLGSRPNAGNATLSIGDMVPDDRDGLKRLAERIRARCIGSGSGSGNTKFAPLSQERMVTILKTVGADPSAGCEYSARVGLFARGKALVPYLVEVGLMQMPEKTRRAPEPILAMNRTILYGSPTFRGRDGFKWRDKVRGQWYQANGDLGAIQQAYGIQTGKYPAAVVIHVTCPSPGYSGYGKQQFDTSWLAENLSECYEEVTRPIRKQRAGESRRKNTQRVKPNFNIEQQLHRMLPEVLHVNTKGGKFPIMLRQLYYASRKDPIWDQYPNRLQYGTFCAYVTSYENKVGHHVCLKDPRGTLIEPHSGRELRLGTDAVDKFKPRKWEGHTIIFVEKEGFAHLLKAYKVTKRYDAIIIGAKGFAVEACRTVLQKYKQLLGGMVKVVCLHDADPAGYLIGHDLATNLPRFMDDLVDVEVIDVGLTMADSIAMDLQDEPCQLIKATDGRSRFVEWSKVQNMRNMMLRNPDGLRRPLLEPEAWDSFMPEMARTGSVKDKPTWIRGGMTGRRVELNAMPPELFISWLEGHLDANNCKKVRPPDEMVTEAVQTSRENLVKNEMGAMFFRMMGDDMVLDVMREVGIPAFDLDRVLQGKPEQHWAYLCERAGKSGDDVQGAVERVMKRRMPGMFDV